MGRLGAETYRLSLTCAHLADRALKDERVQTQTQNLLLVHPAALDAAVADTNE